MTTDGTELLGEEPEDELSSLSVIIPSYNEEEYIGKCIASLQDCNYPDHLLEIVLVDNGSTDRTVEIARKMNVKVLVDKKKNIGGLRNLGGSVTVGDIIGFLDADCTVSTDWARNANETLKNKKTGITGSRLVAPKNGNWVERTWALHLLSKCPNNGEVGYINSGNCFLRRKVFKSVGGFSSELETSEDVDLCERLRILNYSVVNNSKIAAVHWGYPKTIAGFLKREVWHGIGSTQKSIQIFWKSKPLLLSFINIFLIVAACVFWILDRPSWALMALCIYLMPIFYLAFLVVHKTSQIKSFGALIVLYSVYGFARMVSVFLALYYMVCKYFNKK